MSVFRETWRALFSLNTRFEIRPFALLLTKCTSTILPIMLVVLITDINVNRIKHAALHKALYSLKTLINH